MNFSRTSMYFNIIFSFSSVILCNLVSSSDSEYLHPLSDEFIDLINKKGIWRAGRNFHPDTPIDHIKRLMGTKYILSDREFRLPQKNHNVELINSLPETFDARQQWPSCDSLSEIRDQGSCGSCWAFGAVEAMTDRYCIFSNGTKKFHFSGEDLVACDQSENNMGCHGGDPYSAWLYWTKEGLVSGGNYGSQEGCKPYPFPECSHFGGDSRPNCTGYNPTPPCKKTCRNGYSVSYQNDKRYGKSAYLLKNENDMRADIFVHGPIEAAFAVYEDFLHYKDGVYEHVQGEHVGDHAVKILGWGVENGKEYWLVANSWNSGWGNQGYFKIRRGKDECQIEENSVAGEPKIK